MPKILRRILWLGLFLLTLAALFSGLRLWLDSKGRAVLAAHAARHPAPVKPAMPHAAAAQPGSIPAAQIPLFAGAYSADSAVRSKFRTLLREWDLFQQQLRSSNRVSFSHLELGDPFASDRFLISHVGAQGLNPSGKYTPVLIQLEEACELGPWDFSGPAGMSSKEQDEARSECRKLLSQASLQYALFAQSAWRGGSPEFAYADWRKLLNTRRRMEETFTGDTDIAMETSCLTVNTARAGLALGGWRDEDLQAVAHDLDTAASLEMYRQRAEQYRQRAAERLAQYSNDRSILRRDFTHPWLWSGESLTPFQDMAEFIGNELASDTQIAANAALVDLRFQQQIDLFNYHDHTFAPPLSTNSLESADSAGAADTLDRAYFHLADRIFSRFGGNSLGGRTALRRQALQDQTRLALALEAHKRSTGAYPDSLDAMAPFFPGGPPHDVATGQSYFYEKNADGTFRLWGTGIDQRNDGGTPDGDLVWRLDKER